ncbi:hypothetical protein Tco_0814727, partial [Tanacetum coccineum]
MYKYVGRFLVDLAHVTKGMTWDDGLEGSERTCGYSKRRGYGLKGCAFNTTSTTHIAKRIDKIERQITDWKLKLVDDDGKPLPKVVSMGNVDSDSEVEDVVDDHVVFMASTCLKRGADSGYGTISLLEQRRTTKGDDNNDPCDDDLYESHHMSENLQAICDDLDIT